MPTPKEDAALSDPGTIETPAHSTIAARAEVWRERLTQSSDLLHGYQDGGTRWARLRDVAGRFNIWASNMGVFAALHASLDYRLRDLADVKELILEQLDYMVEGFDRLITVLDGLGTSSGTINDADYYAQSMPAGLEEVDAILSSLSTSIDWLHRLANMIRRASFLRQNEKASTFALGDDLTRALETLFHYWIKRDFPNILDDDLRKRLVSTMLLRHRRILYRRSRQAKLALHIVKSAPEPAKRTLNAPSAVSGLSVAENTPREAQSPSGVASTRHTATTIQPERLRRIVSTPSRVSDTRSIQMTSSEKNMAPPPPHIANNEPEFVCPFCCLILPAVTARNHDLWSAHVKKDLDPYVCTFFPCADEDHIFSTSADWISHQQTHCYRWYCTSKTHASEMFATQEDYINHMRSQHPGKFRDSQLPLLAENSRRPLKNIFDACPLCGHKSQEKGKSLEDHVAHHLQYLALKSLPLHEDPDGAEYAKSDPSIKPRSEETVPVSRTTMKSEKHEMPAPIFSSDDLNTSEAVFAVDDAIPESEEQTQLDIEQVWQTIRLRKTRLLNKDVAMSQEELKAWLSPADHKINQKRAQDFRQEGFGEWLFQHQHFVSWKSKPASFLWLYGIPGCGKTMLSSAVIDFLQGDAPPGGRSHTLIYFSFDYLDSRKRSFNDAIASLVSQLYYQQPESQQHLGLLWSSCMEGREQPSTQDLIATFEKMLQDAGETWLILDALDECRTRDSHVEPGLLKWLQDIQSGHQGLHVLVTSRPSVEIMKSIGDFANPLDLAEDSQHMHDLPPKVLIELMKDDQEIEIFEDFKVTAAKKLHSGFTQKAVYDDQRAVYAPLPSSILSSTLSEAMLHIDLIADLKYKPQGCGWEDVLSCIAIAKASYDEKGKSSKVRAWPRNADTTVDFLKSLAGIIPDEKGLSVLRQGLVIIFQAWQKHIKNKEEILRQLEDLPVLLSTATEKWRLYPRDERLKDAVRNLYETVVDSLSILIRILLRHGSFIPRNMHRTPTVESQRIDDITNTVTRAKEALEDCVNRLEHERPAKTYDASTGTLSEARAIRQTIHEHHDIMMREMNHMEARLSELRLTVDNRARDILKDCFREVLASSMQAGLFKLVEETEYCQRIDPFKTVQAPRPTGSDKLLISKDELLLHLNLGDVGSIVEDVDRIRQQGTNVASEGRELARKIMTMAQFTEWVQKDHSRLLLVDGHCKDLGNGKTSPLSVLYASLASNFAESDSLVILQYYCGHHGLDSNGLPAGPLGLIRSLLAQLLRKPDDVLPQELEIDRELYDRVNPDDIDNLCEIFGIMFSQINRNKILLCIIDEIAEFEGERGGWADGMSLVTFQLRWMVHQFQGPQRLKVLMSSANKSAVVSQLLEDNDKISFRGSGLPNHSPGSSVLSDSGFSFP